MRARDLMTPDVVTVRSDTPIAEVIRLMLDRGVSTLPVLEEGELRGMVREDDLLRRAETGTEQPGRHWLERLVSADRDAAEYARTHGMTAGEVMSTTITSVEPATPAGEIADLMEERGLRHVVVLETGKLVGMVSRSDFLRALAARLARPSHESDRRIRERLIAELTAHRWGPSPADVTVLVEDGVVHYWGTVHSAERRQAMIVAAENVPGVQRVEDHLVDWTPEDPLLRRTWLTTPPP